MNLGHFSLSLTVKDLAASFAFYRSLGFEVYDDHMAENWIILRHGDMLLGLFEGMFDQNILTFHPNDVNAVRASLAAQGIALPVEADQDDASMTFLMLTDPDGNQIMIDQIDPDYQPNT